MHAGWLYNCTKINVESPVHAGVMGKGLGKHLKWPHACYGV